MARVLYVHWNRAEALPVARELRAAGHDVRTETEDGAAAWAALRARPFDALVVSLERLPSHGRRVAKGAGEVPLLFVGGAAGKVEAARREFPAAQFCSLQRLPALLDGLPLRSAPTGRHREAATASPRSRSRRSRPR